MKLKEFAKLINDFPIRMTEENVIILYGSCTVPYEEVLESVGCTKTEWEDFVNGDACLGTYVVVPPGKDITGYDPEYIAKYSVKVKCEPEYGDRNWFTMVVTLCQREYEKRTGETSPTYYEWTESARTWLKENYLADKDIVKNFVDKAVNNEFK